MAISSTSSSLRYFIRGNVGSDAQLNQVLAVRLRYLSRLVSGPPSIGLPQQILRETPATLMACALFPLPIRRLEDPLLCHLYVVRLLSSFHLHATACDLLAQRITSFTSQLTGGNPEASFHIVADIDYILTFWLDRTPEVYPLPTTHLHNDRHNTTEEEETFILEPPSQEEPAPTSRGAPNSAIERLRKEKFECWGEDLGDCSVCYDELKGRKAVIRMPCGHVYHEACIVRWLRKSNSCPLCRSQLQA